MHLVVGHLSGSSPGVPLPEPAEPTRTLQWPWAIETFPVRYWGQDRTRVSRPEVPEGHNPQATPLSHHFICSQTFLCLANCSRPLSITFSFQQLDFVQFILPGGRDHRPTWGEKTCSSLSGHSSKATLESHRQHCTHTPKGLGILLQSRAGARVIEGATVNVTPTLFSVRGGMRARQLVHFCHEWSQCRPKCIWRVSGARQEYIFWTESGG